MTVSPERLFWSFTDSTDKRRAGVLVRHLTIRSSTGTAFELKNARSSIQELSVEVHRLDDGRAYDIVATLDELPTSSLSGIITFDTSLASNPRIEVPVEVSVLRQPTRGAPGGIASADTGQSSLSRLPSSRPLNEEMRRASVASCRGVDGFGSGGKTNLSSRPAAAHATLERSRRDISLEEAVEVWSNGMAIFIDAREPQDYAAGHIGSAFNLPALSFEAYFGEVAPLLTPTSRIVVYCDGPQCDFSHRVSERLRQMGFTNVQVLTNGWSVWRQAGLP